MSESHHAEEWMTDTPEITDEEALFLSELPAEEFDAQLEQLRKQHTPDKLGGVFDDSHSPTAGLGAMNKPRELVREGKDDLDDMISMLGQEGSDAMKRFQTGGQVADIDAAIEKLGQARERSPDCHPNKPFILNNLGVSHALRFERLGNVADLYNAIELKHQAVDLAPDDHPEKPMYISNLGISYKTRFKRLGEIVDIDKAIELNWQAVDLTPNGHPNKPMYFNNLGNSFFSRFGRLGEMTDIDKSIELNRQAVDLNPDDHPKQPIYLNNLGISHQRRFECLGEVADIDKAIESQCQAVDLTPDGHPNKPMYLTNLGASQQMRFKRLGETTDIESAIVSQGLAVILIPDGHPNKAGILSNQGISHEAQFERLGKMADIDKAIELNCQAVNLIPDDHPDKPGRLSSLAISHQTRFKRLGEMADIDKAIELKRQAVDLTPDGHPNKPGRLNNLGSFHLTRFDHLGEMTDIEKATELNCQAVDLTPDGHPDKPGRLNNLGDAHRRRSECFGQMADIDKAIELNSQAVDLTPDGHPNKPGRIGNLGTSHLRRFERLGEIADIDKAIELNCRAVKLTPGDHPDMPGRLNNLGTSHKLRFEGLGGVTDIYKAIESQRQSVDLTPDGHSDKPMYFNNLGNSHQARFDHLGEMADIDKAIDLKRQAVDLTPDGHPSKPDFLSNLGISHGRRFDLLGEVADIDRAIELKRLAVNLTPDSHPHKAGILKNLGTAHNHRFESLGEMADIDNAIDNFEQCATSASGSPITRFMAPRAWISALRLKKQKFSFHTQGLRPHHTLINLIPELVWLGAPVHHRFQTIQEVVGSSIHEAVSAAIRAQELELAVEWMEQGRSIVWSQLRRLRSPVAELQSSHPVLAREFQDIQRRIEISFLPRKMDNETEPSEDALEQQAQAHRHNTQKREDLLAEIRSKQGFESFLRPERFSVLSRACQGCLVVLLTVAGEECDALRATRLVGKLTHGRLGNRGHKVPALFNVDDNLPIQDVTLLGSRLRNRGEGPATLDLEPMSLLLAELWERIVHPIVVRTEHDLFHLTEDRLPHITWCPSGPLSFLPFHAAGIYGPNSEEHIGISDYAVSSYTPSLMALLMSSNTVQFGRPSILMVTQPNTPGQKPLLGTTVEAKKIMKKAELNDVRSAIYHLSQNKATVSAVIAQLETHGWVHLACHGTQIYPDSLESSFALHDGRLTLVSLMQKSMEHAQFAFLSACQTATGNQTIPDEAMHLTSGMLAAGFRSVVGTIWSIEDSIAPEVAEAFYAMLFEEGRKSGWKVKPEPAYALHFALQKLRKESTGDGDLMKWVPFVHYGI